MKKSSLDKDFLVTICSTSPEAMQMASDAIAQLTKRGEVSPPREKAVLKTAARDLQAPASTRIKAARLWSELSLLDVVKATGVSERALIYYENGQRVPDNFKLSALVDAIMQLGISGSTADTSLRELADDRDEDL